MEGQKSLTPDPQPRHMTFENRIADNKCNHCNSGIILRHSKSRQYGSVWYGHAGNVCATSAYSGTRACPHDDYVHATGAYFGHAHTMLSSGFATLKPLMHFYNAEIVCLPLDIFVVLRQRRVARARPPRRNDYD